MTRRLDRAARALAEAAILAGRLLAFAGDRWRCLLCGAHGSRNPHLDSEDDHWHDAACPLRRYREAKAATTKAPKKARRS